MVSGMSGRSKARPCSGTSAAPPTCTPGCTSGIARKCRPPNINIPPGGHLMRNAARQYAVASFLCVLLLEHRVVAARAAPKNAVFDWTVFNALPDQDKTRFVLATLDAR